MFAQRRTVLVLWFCVFQATSCGPITVSSRKKFFGDVCLLGFCDDLGLNCQAQPGCSGSDMLSLVIWVAGLSDAPHVLLEYFLFFGLDSFLTCCYARELGFLLG